MRVAPLDPQDSNALWRRSGEIAARVHRFNRLAKGATQEQLDAEERELDAKARKVIQGRKERKRVGPRTQEEMNVQLDLWDLNGISREEQDWLVLMYGFQPERPATPRFFKKLGKR